MLNITIMQTKRFGKTFKIQNLLLFESIFRNFKQNVVNTIQSDFDILLWSTNYTLDIIVNQMLG